MALRTPDSFITTWLAALRAAGRSPATITQYTEAANCYLAFLGREADTATRLDARRFQQHLLDTRSPGGASLYLRSIKAAYSWAAKEELIDANPFQGLSIRPPEDAQTTASREQIEWLIRTASSQSDKRQAARDTAIVTVLATTGCRRGELGAVTISDVDLTSGMLHLPVSKSRARTVPLTDKAVVALSRWMRWRGTRPGSLWLVQDGGVLITKTVRRLSRGTLTPHSLRRSFATSWLAAGGSESALIRLAGWRGSDMVRVYTRASADRLAHDEFRRLMS